MAQRRNRLSILATMMMKLVLALACGAGPPTDETIDGQEHLPTPAGLGSRSSTESPLQA